MRLPLPALQNCELPGVRIAWADLDDPRRVGPELETCLALDERERARRFRFERDRQRFVVAHAVLRGLLAQQLDGDPGAIELVAGAFGKPRLGGAGSGLAFNLSHTGPRAFYALAPGGELGVDAEALKPLADMARLAQDVFSQDELVEWQALPEAQRVPGFYNGWTRKEAVVKALGRGLDYPLGDFSVSLAPGRDVRLLRVPPETDSSDWSLAALSPEPGYVAAVVCWRPPAR